MAVRERTVAAASAVSTSGATPASDTATRDRLLDAATRLFSTEGFQHVTVRDICARAKANVAAVNYHFGGKQGLYDLVVDTAIATMQGTTTEMRKAGEGRTPEEQLEAYIRVFLTRVALSRDSWIHGLMTHEMTNPTAAAERVMGQVLKPRIALFREAIAAIMGVAPGDDRVGLCTISVQSQLLALRHGPIATRMAPEKMTPASVDKLARHIACFSIAGIRAIASH